MFEKSDLIISSYIMFQIYLLFYYSEHPEFLCGLLSLLELIPPTEKNLSFLTKLIANTKSSDKLENIKFVISIFTRWNDGFSDLLIKAMTNEVANKIKDTDN